MKVEKNEINILSPVPILVFIDFFNLLEWDMNIQTQWMFAVTKYYFFVMIKLKIK